ncbi:RiPP maturation radical SAM C-methyltransferase [Kibdelosporangium persicum]|uniref:Ribosomal peptide maturation radical SAM protein 1 n=1 Tax=Kibdelosporangium persicum TaxID=2698649 RepID=A0ABX2FI64_9PSEU|nr:RiPP maturation radical SAM C-methyltransferase [Kibdelosporangium persicum]NRN71104.1 Ribosomal peptide maturation radical SAM protein 1 [Kibdelosporangium persicum]
MLRVAFVNMPFADWNRPSFALSQLSALVSREFAGAARAEVHNLNIDFVEYCGVETYEAIAGDLEHLLSGVGEWLFRQVAFPESADNADEYFRRYYRGRRWRDFRVRITELRAGLADYCGELVDRYDLAGADVVGFTSMFAQNVPSIAIARVVKDRNPGAVTVIGGANCEAPMGTVIAAHVPTVDYTFSGPALHTFPEFLRCLVDDTPEKAHTLPGVVTARNYTQARYGQAVGRDRDIEDFFEPDFSSFVTAFTARREQLGEQAARTEPTLFFETSRGCWWGQRSHCTFCGLNGLGMGYRSMSAETALRQFRRLFEYTPWCKSFACTDNIMPKSYPRDVFAHLDAPDGVTVFYEIKVPVADKDMAAMARANVRRVQPGIEALSTDTLKLMRKGTTAFLNLQFLKSCLRHSISPDWNLLVGFPKEHESVYEKYARDIPLLTHLPPPTGAHMVRFDRYSPYHTERGEYGLDLRPLPFYELVYPFDEAAIEHLAYFFTDQKLAPYTLNAAKWLPVLNASITRWRDAWDRRRPTLSLRGEEVLDTRWGDERRVTLDETARVLLRRLSSPVQPERLPAELNLPADDVLARLAQFDEQHLLFREEKQILSLVTLDDR